MRLFPIRVSLATSLRTVILTLKAYINWNCTPNKDSICDEINTNCSNLKNIILNKQDPQQTVSFTHFTKKPYTTKKGQQIMRQEAETIDDNLEYIIQFIETKLNKIIHHGNQLCNFRKSIDEFNELFDCIYIDIDFSEKLTVLLKYEPQSMHWSNSQVIVHSGILKVHGDKSYHTYLSDDLIQDHVFVNIVLDGMLKDSQVDGSVIVIGSDNCATQYKCAVHFWALQQIANTYNTTLIRFYGIAGHGKGEVDHIGGITQNKVRHKVAAGSKLHYSEEMNGYLFVRQIW